MTDQSLVTASGLEQLQILKMGTAYRRAKQTGPLSHSRRPVRSPNRRVFEKERRLILSLRVARKLEARRIRSELRRHHDLKLWLDLPARE